jgi:phosphatidylglycerol---prolipoprotein diacylglyceryl transferase
LYPVLFTVGGLTIHAYGVMAVVAMIAAGLVVQRLSERLSIDPGASMEVTVAAIVGGLAGARLYWIAEHWHEVRGDLLHAVSGGAGFTWYGGLLGGLAAVLVAARMRRLPIGTVANVMAPAVALGYAVARIGCFLAGDGTYGRPSDLPWAMAFPRGVVPTTVRVQPTALYETLAMIAVFLVLYRMARRPQPGWCVFAWFLVLSGVERFAVEFLRVNSTWLLGLTPPQWFAISGVLIGLTILIVTRAHSADRLSATA